MVSLQQITIEWGGDVDGTSVFHFMAGVGNTGQRRDALEQFCENIESLLVAGVTWRIANEGKIFDHADGGLEGTWSDASVKEGTGTSGVEGEVAQATQALVRWKTDVVRGRRLLQGRTFIPGLNVNDVVNGELSSGAMAQLLSAATTLRDFPNGEIVTWGRPHPGTSDGAFGVVTSVGVWNELATLRPRRRA